MNWLRFGKNVPKSIIAGGGLLSLSGAALAELELASPFSDRAVLQREQAVAIWGKAESGSEVTVSFAGQMETTLVNEQGKWEVKLAPMEASSIGRVLTVRDSSDTIVEIEDVVVGEVWICAGQSNMKMEVSRVPEVKAIARKVDNVRTYVIPQMVAMTEQDRMEGSWESQPPSSAVACAFAHFLQEETEVPVGVIQAAWGSSSLEAWMPRAMTEVSPHFKIMMEEFDTDTETLERIESILSGKRPWSTKDDIFLRRQSNILYNAMIHPLIPYSCRGLVWYQGERNAQSIQGMVDEPWFGRHSGMLRYGQTLQRWIECYRQRWNNESMHFMVVMLPGYYKPLSTGPRGGATEPATHSWAWMRESQLMALELPHTSIVNTIDLGDVKNIHPRDKLPIGKRLALAALRDVLGEEIVAQGPIVKEVVVQDSKLMVSWTGGEGLRTVDGKAPSGFWIADNSSKWVEAQAKLEGETVILSSDRVSKPLYARYAFSGKPNVNLVNGVGLPAYPFRTDDFKP